MERHDSGIIRRGAELAPAFLVVASEAKTRRWEGMLRPFAEVDVCDTMTEGAAAVAERPYVALVCTYALRDGDGVQLIAKARRRDRDLYTVLVVSRADIELLHLAARQRAFVVPEPLDADSLEAHALAAMRRSTSFTTRLGAVLDAYALVLTPRMREITELGCLGLTPSEIAASMDRSPNTLRKHIELLLPRVGAPNWLGWITRVLVEVAGGVPPHRPRLEKPRAR